MLNQLGLLAFHKTYLFSWDSLLFIILFSHVSLDFLPLAGLKQSQGINVIQRVFHALALLYSPESSVVVLTLSVLIHMSQSSKHNMGNLHQLFPLTLPIICSVTG